jgi:hypothetical protein
MSRIALSSVWILSGVVWLQALFGVTTPACAAEPPSPRVIERGETGRVRYEAAFFAQFSPRTALDMVRQVPSFSFRDTDKEQRGYAHAVGNVLIDGARPSAKSQSLEDILSRIPAAQVRWIEVLRGTESRAEAYGDAVVANVVRTRAAGTGSYSLGVEDAPRHGPAPSGNLAWTGRIGRLDYGLGANTYSLHRELPGTRRVLNGAGELTELREETSPRRFEQYALNGEGGRDLGGGRLRVTGQIFRSHYHQANTLMFQPIGAPRAGDQLAPYSEGKRALELGVNFDTRVGAWSWTLVAIATRSRFDSDSRTTNRDTARAVTSMYHQTQARESGESIVRATLARPLASGQQLQFGVEGALNTLDAALDITGEYAGAPVSIYIPNADLRVAETRAETFVSYTWRSTRWSAEARLGGESSHLDFSGDAEQVVDLSYLKPSVQLARSFGEQNQVRLRVYRDVSQLDFNDFASAVSLTDSRVDGGNPDLRPQTAWRLELGVDVRPSAQTALSARVFRDWLDDVVDLVPLGDPANGIAAPGNIGRGFVNGLQLTFATPLAPILPGATLNVDATLQDASVVDPLTGETRRISKFVRNKVRANFRQDLPRHGIAWGLQYLRTSAKTDYRLAQTDRRRASPSLDIFVERDVFHGMKARVSVISMQGSAELRTLKSYDGDRNRGLLTVEEMRYRPGRWVTVTLTGAL